MLVRIDVDDDTILQITKALTTVTVDNNFERRNFIYLFII